MIQTLFRKIFKRGTRTPGQTPEVIRAKTHGIQPAQVTSYAVKVCQQLQSKGFQAYIVGGAVRDLLLGESPKDYDVATDATPEQVRKIFRRARIIGRRFRIVHVLSGRETIEVTTFRAALNHGQHHTDAHGRLLHDNDFGSQAEDAARRDFTVNALYYNPSCSEIIDYHNGMADLQTRTLRMIGDPATRYREDPVRMLRAIRLSAKLDLKMAEDVQAPIRAMQHLLSHVPNARLFDETLKLLLSGNALACLKQLRDYDLHHHLIPMLDSVFAQPQALKFIEIALANTDQRVQQSKPVSPGFLFAVLLWHYMLQTWTQYQAANSDNATPVFIEVINDILDTQCRKLAITRRISGDIKDIWALQPRFEHSTAKAAWRLLEQPRYRAGWDFLKLRAQAGEIPMDLVTWWDNFAAADTQQRATLLNQPDAPIRKSPRRRRRKPRPSSNTQISDNP